MRRILFATALFALTSVAASTAHAGPGVNLRWSDCFGDGGASNRSFACNTNAGSNVLVGSFVLSSPIANVSGQRIGVDLSATTTTLPDWWMFRNAGTCRTTSLGFNVTANPNDVVCVDWAAGQSAGGIGAYNTELGTIDGSLSAQHRRLKIALAVPLSALADLVAGTEYYSCNVTVNNAKTVGTGACAGCTTPMCIVLNSVKVTTNTPGGAGDVTLGNASAANSNIVTWQGTGPNCLLVPTKNVTWGSVKSLYR